MILLDSNIIINSTKPEAETRLIEFLAENDLAASVISKLEVLGYDKLTDSDRTIFEHFFAVSPVFAVTDEVIDRAISLRQVRKMSLGDAIIAATALENSLTLATCNTKDFTWITSLNLIDPSQPVLLYE